MTKTALSTHLPTLQSVQFVNGVLPATVTCFSKSAAANINQDSAAKTLKHPNISVYFPKHPSVATTVNPYFIDKEQKQSYSTKASLEDCSKQEQSQALQERSEL